jgi:hypothetical protein
VSRRKGIGVLNSAVASRSRASRMPAGGGLLCQQGTGLTG